MSRCHEPIIGMKLLAASIWMQPRALLLALTEFMMMERPSP